MSLSRAARLAAIPLAALCFTFLAPPLARAQSTSSVIRGNVVDSNGGVLPGATVTAKNTETGLTRPSITDGHGTFQINALPPGSYTVTVELSGFATQNHPALVLAIGETATLHFTMTLASVQESVTVTGEAPLVDISKSNLQMSVAPRDVDQLPLVGRQFMDLANLAPGVSVDNSSANAGSDNVSFAGFGENYKSTWLEGMDINDEQTNGGTGLSQAARFNLPLEAVQEFQVLSNSYSTEFGRSGTGAINILTKSGTNTFHGRGFYYLRDHSFQKPNALAKGNPPFREQQSGATLGGPIRQNKIWFFATFENQYLNDEVTVSVPSFVLPIITDPSTDVVQPTRNNTFFGKLTLSMSPNEYLNVIGLYGHDLAKNDSVGGTKAADNGDNKLQTDKMVDVTLTSVFTNSLTNSLRVLGSDGLKYRPPNAAISPEVQFPSITYGTATNFFQGRDQKNFTVMDTVNFHLGTRFGIHDFKFGGMINRVQEIDTEDTNIHGAFEFLRDALPVPGDPSTYPYLFEINQGNATLDLSPSIYAAFAEDAWQPVSNLTITAGVRYDLDQYNDNGALPLPNMSRNEFLVRFMTGDLQGNTYKPNPTDYGDVAPRIGIAWDPSHDGKTVVRAGYGLYYDRLSDTSRGSIIRQQPYYTDYRAFANDVRVTGIPNTFFPNLPDLSTLASAGSTRVDVPDPISGRHTPYTHQATVGIEQQVGSASSVSADYVRMRGFHFPMTYNINARLPNGGYPIDPSGIQMNIRDLSDRVDSDQVQFTVKQRLKDRITFQTSYTYMRLFTFQSDPVNKQDIFSAENWGPGANDVRHRLVFSGAWTLPANFQISGIVNWNSAPPYTVTTGVDANGDRDVNDRPIVNGAMVSPNSARGDSFFRTDLRLSKGFKISGGRLDVLWEMNNIFNTINYGGYIGNMKSVRFGQPTYALTPFQGQLGIRYTF